MSIDPAAQIAWGIKLESHPDINEEDEWNEFVLQFNPETQALLLKYGCLDEYLEHEYPRKGKTRVTWASAGKTDIYLGTQFLVILESLIDDVGYTKEFDPRTLVAKASWIARMEEVCEKMGLTQTVQNAPRWYLLAWRA